ncbi:MAG: hypothetical protein M3Q99_19665 [Acidobacteriota bacterium]|nr:hypothetical protein [Acidobacteriota bacterium]
MQNCKAVILVIIFAIGTACSPTAQSSVADRSPVQSPVAVVTPLINPNALCSRVSEIKHLSSRVEPDDPAHIAILEAGEAVLPCLIEKVADSTPMEDPRGIPGPTDTRVGDVAYFLIVDIGKLDFIELLPAEVQKEYETEGVYAYHWFVSKRKNRLELQAKLKEWYEQKYGARK